MAGVSDELTAAMSIERTALSVSFHRARAGAGALSSSSSSERELGLELAVGSRSMLKAQCSGPQLAQSRFSMPHSERRTPQRTFSFNSSNQFSTSTSARPWFRARLKRKRWPSGLTANALVSASADAMLSESTIPSAAPTTPAIAPTPPGGDLPEHHRARSFGA